MKGRRHTPEQVVRKLREADQLLGEGQDIAEVAKHLEISEATFHRWRAQYGAMKANDAKELRQLRDENLRLKRMVADRELQIELLKEISWGNFCARLGAGQQYCT
jgi:transposase-like protein